MKKIWILLIVFLPTGILTAQSVIKVTEMDESKKYLLNGSARKAFINSSLVDINSTLRIEIDKTELLKLIKDTANAGLPEKTTELIGFLTNVLQQQNRILDMFKRAVRSYDPSDAGQMNKFNDSLKVLGLFAKSIFIKDPVTKKYYNALPLSVPLIEGIFIAINQRIENLNTELLQFAGKKNSIQLGAWIHNRTGNIPVHIPGFDKLPEQEYYSVERWQIMPSEEQMKQLQQLQSYARENRDNGLTVINTFIQKTADELTGHIEDMIRDNMDSIQSIFAGIKADISTAAIQSRIETLVKDYTGFVRELQPKTGFYQSMLSAKPLRIDMLSLQLLEDGQFFIDQVSTLSGDMKAILTEIESLTPASKAKAEILKTLVQDRINKLVNKLARPDIKGLIEGYKVDVASLDYSDKVLKLSFTKIPVVSELDLGTTGKRGEGDRILLKLNLVNEAGESQMVEVRDISMFSVAVHTQGTVGVIFAHPTVATAITKQFQMAPYYNLLFKSVWPWTEDYHRRSVANNSFWDFSWGLHVSTPDFNKDDVPELGIGVVISGIRDILQIGFAHNVFENKPYWFFGIKLPVPSMNFGGSGNVTGN